MYETLPPRPNWFIRCGDAFSQFLNTAFLNGDPNESISGRSYREFVLEGNNSWGWAYRSINRLFAAWPLRQDNHCKEAFDNDLLRARVKAAQYQSLMP